MVELCSAISGEVVAQLAVMEPEEQVVKELMRSGEAEIDISRGRVADDYQALHIAKADADKADNDGLTALHAAKDGATAIHLAALAGQTEVVRWLILFRVDIDKLRVDNETAQHLAENDHLPVVRLLLNGNADKDEVKSDGASDLHLAAAKLHPRIVHLLLEFGADQDLVGLDNGTALHLAVWKGRLPKTDTATQPLLKARADIDKLAHFAAASGHLEVLQPLLECNADRETIRLDDGRKALHVATAQDARIEVGATATALHFAAFHGHLDILRLLLVFGGETDLAMNNGTTALHLAACKGHFEALGLLLDFEADGEKITGDGLTASQLLLCASGVAFCAFAVGLATHTLSFQDGVKAFTDEVLWLVVLAFFFTKGFAKTGLGERIALSIVRVLGGTTLGLAYGLNLAEGVLAAGMPSSAARAAGIFYPLVDAVAKACSGGKKDSTGGFLIQSAFQATGNSSSLWLYGAATNLLMLRLAAELGYVVNAPFTSWLKASCVPALAAMVLTPLVAFVAMPPKVKRTPEAPKEAKKKLR
ncbi:Dicarboxylate transporter 2.1, partial [Durusdinium trenchii]